MNSKILLGEEDFDLEELKKKVVKDDTGAVMTFSDIVKKKREGTDLRNLEVRIYEGMTRNEMKRVKDETLKEFDITGIVLAQRIGVIDARENVMGIVVSAPEIEEAIEGSVSCLEKFREYVPLWKKETTIDGKEHWVEEADELHSLYNRMVKWI
ncbi:MAG: molybdenum cofactor biosynthesis protein MoaE [Candidatus Thermoplasmatota archaeon]